MKNTNTYENNWAQDMKINISEHAFMRMKKRNGWSRKAATRMIDKVYRNGLRPKQVKGYLKWWINDRANEELEGSELVLFGEKLYIFRGHTMVTVLPTPTKSCLLRGAC